MHTLMTLIQNSFINGELRGDSVLEARFWGMLGATRSRWQNADQQVQFGPYRVDAVVDCDGQRVVIETDGAAFHKDLQYEIERDAYLLTNGADVVIRIPYHALRSYGDAAFAVLGRWYPRFRIEPLAAARLEALSVSLEDIGDSGSALQIYSMNDDEAVVGNAWAFLGRYNTATITRKGQVR